MDFVNPYTVIDIPLLELLRNLSIGVILAVTWALIISKSTRLVVDSRQYLPVFLLLIPSMVLIITIIKTSIALSLGLVGALSIVRFRTPIKEPEELLYIFVAIAIGLGLGANQVLATLIGFAVIALVMIPFGITQKVARSGRTSFIDIVLYKDGARTVAYGELERILAEQQFPYRIKRLFETQDRLEVLLDTTDIDLEKLERLRARLFSLSERVELSLTDNARVIT